MAQRTIALCDGKYIGIESIYTVRNGQQINIAEKLKELRVKSQNNELYCPCGCGANLILVAGDKNLRKQHFRLKGDVFNLDCNVTTEGKTSIDSKIVLKCWLDDKLKVTDIETRVPIQTIDDSNRKYEFSFLSKEKKIAVSYCYDRSNLSDEKIEILKNNGQGIHIIYIVNVENSGSSGQYPEGLMKVQNRQGYCLLVDVVGADYKEAIMIAVFYAQDIDDLWKEITFAKGKLSDFSIDKNGQVLFCGEILEDLKKKAEGTFIQNIENEKIKRAKEEKRRAENLKRLAEEAEGRQKQREEEERRRVELEIKRQTEIYQRKEDFNRNIDSILTKPDIPDKDAEGNYRIKCKFCGKKASDSEFVVYGGKGEMNLGICRECWANNPAVEQKSGNQATNARRKYDPSVCPECGGKLKEKNGPYGKFVGCNNYPRCRYRYSLKRR